MFQIGFDMGGSKIAAGLVDGDLNIAAANEIPFPAGRPYQIIVSLMKEMVFDLCSSADLSLDDIESIGLSVPGEISKDKRTIVNAYNLQFHHVPIVEEMEKTFPGRKLFLANDADAATLAELHKGVLYGCRTAMLITLGTGVGGGIVLGGKLFDGGLSHGVEPGHMVLMHGGPVCSCGNRGCVESLCSATWIIRQGRKAVIEYPSCMIYTKAKGELDNVDAKLVFDCAKGGDAVAVDIISRYADQLSSAIISFAALLDPEAVALGGGVSLAGEFLLDPVRKLVSRKSFLKYPYKIVQAKFGNDAGIIGAASLIRC